MDPNFHVTSATFSQKFTRFSEINKLIQSPACWIQNMPWKIFIEPVVRDNKKYLSVFVSCAAPITKNPWSCRASVRMYKLDGTRPKIIRTTKFLVFDSAASTSWGHDTFILWDTVLNPANGFIKNDVITIEVIIDAEVPLGVQLTANYFTDERATATLKLRDQTISTLQSKIQELTNQNEQLNSTNKTSSEQISNLKNLLEESRKESAKLEKEFNDEHNAKIELQKSSDDGKNQISQLKQNNDNLTKTLDEKNTKIDSLSRKLSELETSKEELTNCKGQIDESQKKYGSLLDEFENYKRVITNTGSESENELKTQIDTMKNDNIELKKQFSLIQNKLNDANVKLKQADILQNKVQELGKEKDQMQKKVLSVSSELSEAQTVIEKIKKEAKEEQEKSMKEKDDSQTQIQSLKSQLYESLVKLKISQDMNDDIQKLQTEKNRLIEQMKIGYEKYNKLKQERIALNSQIDNLNKQTSDANDNINKLKTEVENKQKEIENCKDQLTVSNDTVSDFTKTNEDLKKKLNEANSKISSFANSTSQDMTNLANEKNSLFLQLQSVENELKEMKNKKMDEQVLKLNTDKTDLEDKLGRVNKELEETKLRLLNVQKDVNKMILFERNLSALQSQFDSTNHKLKQLENKNLDEVVSKLSEDKNTLQSLLTSLKQELEETKAKLNDTQTGRTQVKTLEDENVKLKEQISSLQNMLERTNSTIQTLNEQKDQKNKVEEQTHQNEDPDFGVDVVKGTGDEKKEPIQKLNVVKTPKSNDQEDVEDLAEIPAKESLELRLDTMNKQFKKQLKDVDNAMQGERKTLTKKIDELLQQLDEEKQKQEVAVQNRTKFTGEICRLEKEIGAMRKMKNEFSAQLKTCQNICTNTFQIIIDILKNLKTSGKLSCTVEALIISYFKTIKHRTQLWNSEDITQSTNNVVGQPVNTDVLQTELNKLRAHYEESCIIIEKSCSLEHNQNSRLRTANNELVVVIENEMSINKQYKEMLKIANSRLENYRKQFNDLNNEFLDEKSRRYEFEEANRRSKVFAERTESLLSELKIKMLRHAIKLNDIEDSDIPEMNPALITNSNDDVENTLCTLIYDLSSTAITSANLPAKITNGSIQNRKNLPEVSSPNGHETHHPTPDGEVNNLVKNNGSTETAANISMSSNSVPIENPVDGKQTTEHQQM